MNRKGFFLKEAYEYVQSKRRIISPNWGFIQQLQEYECKIKHLDESTLKVEIPPENEDQAIRKFGHRFVLDITPADFDIQFTEFINQVKSIIEDKLSEYDSDFDQQQIKWLGAEEIIVAYGSWKARLAFRAQTEMSAESLCEILEDECDDLVTSCYAND
jgi:hypothetical protein